MATVPLLAPAVAALRPTEMEVLDNPPARLLMLVPLTEASPVVAPWVAFKPSVKLPVGAVLLMVSAEVPKGATEVNNA